MNIKPLIKFFYPSDLGDSVHSQLLQYRIGLILLLCLSCSMCTVYYINKGSVELQFYTLAMSVYFLSIPCVMKYMGSWKLFGCFCCAGWLAINLVIGNHISQQTLGLNFFQSLIPSYMLLATEDYSFAGLTAIVVGFMSMPYHYDKVYYTVISLEESEIKPYFISMLETTKDLNKAHLAATFMLTIWMSFCKKHEVALMEALKETAEQAKKSTETFFAAFSHEFRNPLNAMLGSLDLLKDDSGISHLHNKDLFQTALDCGEILFHMINNVLDISQINSQLWVPANTCTEPRTIIHKVLNICRAGVVKKDLKLKLRIDKTLPRYLNMDPGRFSQILMNLVSNAIKFTDQGSIKVKVKWAAEKKGDLQPLVEYCSSHLNGNFMLITSNGTYYAQENTQIKNELIEYWHESRGIINIEVKDSGIGISEEAAKKLFQPFHQADPNIRKQYGGSGLGLWISMSIAKLLGGGITLNSAVGKGSTFLVTLPCEVCEIQREMGLRRNNYRLLLVDHKDLTARSNAEVLQQLNIDVTLANSTAEALRIFKEADISFFDAVFLSFYLPKVDGAQLSLEIRLLETQKKSLCKVPIYIMVSEALKNAEVIIPANINGVLTNPLRIAELGSVVDLLATRKKSRKRILIANDDEFSAAIFSKILQDEAIPFYLAKSGAEAVEVYKKRYLEISVVLLDSNLGDTTGFEIAKRIREFGKSVKRNVGIICISAHSGSKHQDECKSSGIDSMSNFYVVTKPVKREVLVSSLRGFL